MLYPRTYEYNGVPIVCAEWALDGKTVYSVGIDNSLKAWDATTGEQRWSRTFEPGESYAVRDLQVSPSGQLLLVRVGIDYQVVTSTTATTVTTFESGDDAPWIEKVRWGETDSMFIKSDSYGGMAILNAPNETLNSEGDLEVEATESVGRQLQRVVFGESPLEPTIAWVNAQQVRIVSFHEHGRSQLHESYSHGEISQWNPQATAYLDHEGYVDVFQIVQVTRPPRASVSHHVSVTPGLAAFRQTPAAKTLPRTAFWLNDGRQVGFVFDGFVEFYDLDGNHVSSLSLQLDGRKPPSARYEDGESDPAVRLSPDGSKLLLFWDSLGIVDLAAGRLICETGRHSVPIETVEWIDGDSSISYGPLYTHLHEASVAIDSPNPADGFVVPATAAQYSSGDLPSNEQSHSSHNNRYRVVGDGTDVFIVTTRASEKVFRLDMNGPICAVRWTQDDRRVAVGNLDKVLVFDVPQRSRKQ
jgi:WD40 repeat protein